GAARGQGTRQRRRFSARLSAGERHSVMTRWKIAIEYDGGAFSGWQKQKDALSVQQVVEEAIRKFTGENVALVVAGRTDAGVHALGQVAHFDIKKKFTPATIRNAMNAHL